MIILKRGVTLSAFVCRRGLVRDKVVPFLAITLTKIFQCTKVYTFICHGAKANIVVYLYMATQVRDKVKLLQDYVP